MVLDGFGNPADGKSPFLAKNFARNLFLAQNKPPPPQLLHLLALSHFKRWSSLCVLIPLTAQCFKFCSKPRKALQTVFAGGPPSVNWRHHVPESYSRANEAPALGTAFPPPIIHRTHNTPPIIHRTAPRALTTPSCSFVKQTQFNRKSTDTKLKQSKSQPSNAFPPLRKKNNKSEQFQQQQVLSRTCTIFH